MNSIKNRELFPGHEAGFFRFTATITHVVGIFAGAMWRQRY
ncbi:hypothetical protein [Candidatus Williamhamiltonella defendens]|nr:hypothetical protein [Candidatus Hamiltonella defensa]